MAVSTSGALLVLPEATLLALQAPLGRFPASAKPPKIKNAFYRLSEGTWEYLDLCKALCGGNRFPITRRQVSSIWVKFVLQAFETWEKFERSRLVYHIPAGVELLQEWKWAWECVKGAMRSMANRDADEYWKRRQVQLNLNDEEFDITAPLTASPRSDASTMKSLELSTCASFYTHISALSKLYDSSSDQHTALQLTHILLHPSHFDAFTLGIPHTTPSNKLTKKYQNKTSRRRFKKLREQQTLDNELMDVMQGFTFSEPEDKKIGDGGTGDGEKEDWRLDVISGITIGNRFATESSTSLHKQTTVVIADAQTNVGMMFDLPIRTQKRKAADDEDKENVEDGGTDGTTTILPFHTKRQRRGTL